MLNSFFSNIFWSIDSEAFQNSKYIYRYFKSLSKLYQKNAFLKNEQNFYDLITSRVACLILLRFNLQHHISLYLLLSTYYKYYIFINLIYSCKFCRHKTIRPNSYCKNILYMTKWNMIKYIKISIYWSQKYHNNFLFFFIITRRWNIIIIVQSYYSEISVHNKFCIILSTAFLFGS